MITIQVKNIEGKTSLPVPGSKVAAGYDIIALADPTIVGTQLPPSYNEPNWWKSIDYIEYKTGLFISPQPDNYGNNYHTNIFPRSSVRKYNLVLANSIGLVDNDYRGELLVCFKYIWQPEDFIWGEVRDNTKGDQAPKEPMMLGKINEAKIYKKGDKIAQLVTDVTNPTQYVLVSELNQTVRGTGGFGSTDKQPNSESIPEVKTGLGMPKNYTEGVFGLAEAYQKVGGVPVKKRYIDELKEREREKMSNPSTPSNKPFPTTGIRERQP